MFKKTLLAAALTILPLASFTSSAAEGNWVGGVSYSSFSEDIGNSTLDLGTLNLVAGYQFKTSENGSFTPQLSYGFGINDDKLWGVNVDIKRFLTVSVRGQYQWDNNWFIYGQPSYANLKIEASQGGASGAADDWEFGGAAGFGYVFDQGTSVELGLEHYDGSDVITAGLRFAF